MDRLPPQRYSLVPFVPDGETEDLYIEGIIDRCGSTLAIDYGFTGPPGAVCLPQISPSPQRRQGLWTDTCLECFLAPEGEQGYYEVNVSPVGHWNVYRFSGYRMGMMEEAGAGPVTVSARNWGVGVLWRVEVALHPLAEPSQRFRVGISAVMKMTGGKMTYWALHHPRGVPDFHDPDGFCLRL